ncbi:gamma-tubulin complex component GCP6, putative [Paecilomyces variotii No. 5]|uniref:Spindle pole body component n=1 Tax=Byssochlamys spectabilis (strain No. 5 / NBRC 109023) TaxID=1356009 RepID=V5G6Q2_BYSSN|nr:gamma-tubulin complex component GCP6, putative [Paecilomyces variotii No. 5]
MNLPEDDADPFTGRGLWRSSAFTFQPLQPLEHPRWDDDLPDLARDVFQNPLGLIDKNPTTVFQLDVFGTNPYALESIVQRDSSSEEPSTLSIQKVEEKEPQVLEQFENIWSLDGLTVEDTAQSQLKSWDGFAQPAFQEPVSAYLSESGAHGFDAALSHQASLTGLEDSGRLVQPAIFFQSLFRLGLGWNSIFFRYNEQKRIFDKELRDVRISGVSLPAVDGVIRDISQCGTGLQRIRAFVRTNPAVSDQPTALSTLAAAVAILVYSLEKQLSERYYQQGSLLQIQTLFQRCGDLVGTLVNILDGVEKVKSEGEVVSTVLAKCDHFSQRFVWMADLLSELTFRVTQPWLGLVETWLGLRGEERGLPELTSNGFIEAEYFEDPTGRKTEPKIVDYIYHPEMMPSFIPEQQARLIFESGRSLRILKQSHPRHPIGRDDILRTTSPPALHCAISFQDIERIQDKASDYEHRLRSEILRYIRGDSSEAKCLLPANGGDIRDVEMADDPIKSTFEIIDVDDARHVTGLLADSSSLESDKLYRILTGSDGLDIEQAMTSDSPFGPPLTSAFHLSLAPIISAQARLIDFSCLHLLFKEHKMRSHLHLQWRFQLLGDGVFGSRLSNSLFDPEMKSGERRSGVMRSGVHTGLRLGSRDTWPPASSELRLVLMGLLTECYAASESSSITTTKSGTMPRGTENELPGGLSFSIRDLSGDELLKCKNPNAIEALDFLRLQYKPPPVLEAIITPRSLRKYDQLFKYLLRLVRMISVVRGLVRDSTARTSLSGDTHNLFQKFRVDAQHFILSISDYTFHTGVGKPWHDFETTLSKIERYLDRGDIDGTIGTAHSLPHLRDYHEDTLDRILFSLFRTKRHAQAGQLLDDICGTILAFAPLSRLDGESGVRHQSEKTVFQLHVTFRKQVRSFVSYLRSLDAGKSSSRSYMRSTMFGSSNENRNDASTVFEQLLLKLDMKQYY